MFFGRRSLRCSFCRRREAEVAKLVAGPHVYICDRCVAVAAEIMGGHQGAEPPAEEGHLNVLLRVVRTWRAWTTIVMART